MLSRDGRPTPLGNAIAHYGRISKTLRILDGRRTRVSSPDQGQPAGRPPRPDPKDLHGRNGQLYQNYQEGMEDQIGALGLVLNAIVLFNTRYMDAALSHLRTTGFDMREENVARLSPFVPHHINMMGRCSFQLPEMPDGPGPLNPTS
ncbi:Tn3 family transposase [Microbispora sp. CA-102843]|uniref:Tn3 family transposase n=1 Tax=Microbispora sp. CA-102843 TaxID=3239952 RepID=UPI003D90635F